MKTKFLLFKFGALTLMIALLFSTGALAASGVLDTTFGINGIVIADLGSAFDSGGGIALQVDGKILLVGSARLNPDDPYDQTTIVSRYNSNGSVDNLFGLDGKIFPDTDTFSASRIVVQPDGKIIIAGLNNKNFAVVRYNNDGTLDGLFGTNGMSVFYLLNSESYQSLADVALQPDGKIVIVGEHTLSQSNFTDFIIIRFNNNGSPDITFVANGVNIVDDSYFPNSRYNYGKAVVIQPDGKIVMSGNMMDNDANQQISLARFNLDGSLDSSTFGTNGKGTVTAQVPDFKHGSGALVLQTDGKIIVAGSADNNIVLARFNSNGTLDATFSGTGITITDFGANENSAEVRVQADGKIVVVATSSTMDASSLLIVRYNPDGSLDNTFGDSGKIINTLVTSGAGVEVQLNGKILVSGSSNGDAVLLRYDAATPIVSTFKSVGAYDGWIMEYAEFSSTGGSLDRLATTFFLGDGLRDRQYRSILSFNTASLPDKAIITLAQLRIRRQGLAGTDPFTTHGNLYFSINNKAFSNNLALQTSDFSMAFSAGAAQDSITAETFDWYTSTLSPANLTFINKVGTTQFRLGFSKDDNDDLSADYMKFFSGNSVDVNMPQLIITYYIP